MTFIENIVPGNYWLTKSMEIVRIQSSGTFWYLKKWIVYYYFIFFKDNLYKEDYDEIRNIFINFINSLDIKIQDEARVYFNIYDLESNNITLLSDFINTSQTFSNHDEKKSFYLNAKKFYFTYVMNAGGQSGDKEFIKKCIENGDKYEEVLAKVRTRLTDDNRINEIEGLINDYHAFLRNERQLFFYYGLFHGKYAANLSGFYKLTSIGKAIVKANFYELFLIWEHQKLKIVSQPPTVDIQNLNGLDNNLYKKFSIYNHPYYIIIKLLNDHNSFTINEYQYIISRIKNTSDLEFINHDLFNNATLKNKCIQEVNRIERRDSDRTDYLKELKKYLLGIVDLPKDANTNPFAFISWPSRGEDSFIEVIDKKKSRYVLNNYEKIIEYLQNKYDSVYLDAEVELREKYKHASKNSSYIENDERIYDWDKYIINFDKNIIFVLMYVAISSIEKKYEYDITSSKILSYYNYFEGLIEAFNISKKEFLEIIDDVQIKLKQNINFEYKMEESDIDPSHIEKEVSLENIKKLSEEILVTNKFVADRQRSSKLISKLRTYYVNNFSDENKLIKCDCCMSTTFLTKEEIAYLEFHHLIPFSTDLGPDHYLNLFGICPNCHRKMDYLNKKERPKLYEDISKNNNMKLLLNKRIEELYRGGVLEPINLNFLKKEKILNNEQYDGFMNEL